jgi:hypothetical protein
MNPVAKIRRKPRFDTQVPVSLIAGLLLIMILLLWGLGPEPPVIVIADPEPDGCPRGCETPPPDCEVKGNISLRTGERIYHLPGQQYYDKTVIDPADGERWFCTEAEARANGWRKSKR